MSLLSNIVLLLATVWLAGCSSFNAEQDAAMRISAVENTSFQLREGGSAVIEGAGVTIKFDELSADSRCPVSTGPETINCFWEGQIEAHFTFEQGAGRPESIKFVGYVNDGTTSLTHQAGDYVLHLERMDPYPTLPEPSDDPVTATLRLERE